MKKSLAVVLAAVALVVAVAPVSYANCIIPEEEYPYAGTRQTAR